MRLRLLPDGAKAEGRREQQNGGRTVFAIRCDGCGRFVWRIWCTIEDPTIWGQETHRYCKKCGGAQVLARLAKERLRLAAPDLLEAAKKARDLMRRHWSDNPNWRQGQEHTYMGRMDIILQAALGEQP